MELPLYTAQILERLEAAGYEAYVVGGCVRDSLMGMTPHDYDVATSALPAETEKVFEGFRVIETGIKHGTVTVLSQGRQVEVTTYRVDGAYHDGRHPDSVSFTRSIRDDLSRRDFTINGIAFSPTRGLIDPFGGAEDIKRGVIRCIGCPDERFGEDALRIMRALRFASVLGFETDSETARAIVENRALLDKVSRERVFSELKKLLVGDNVQRVMMQFPEIFAQIIPLLGRQIGFEQESRFHDSTLFEHTARAVGASEKDEALRLAMLLHDAAKPLCKTRGEDGECHYYGHGAMGAKLADDILRGLKCDNALRERVVRIVQYHDLPPELSERAIRRQLAKYGREGFFDIMRAHIADEMGKQPECRERIPLYRQIMGKAEDILSEQPCLTVKDLAVKGGDLSEIVPPSPLMGRLLNTLLEEVIDGRLANERAALLKRARELAEKA